MFNIPTQRLAKVTVTETTTAVTLSVNPIVIAALSFTPRHLLVRVNAKTASTAGYERDNIQLQFNGDTGSNYNVHYLSGVGSSTGAARINGAATYLMGQTAADDANYFAGGECLLPDALSTRSHKSAVSLTGANEDILQTTIGRWANTAAITSVTFTSYQSPNQWLAGSTFELYVVDETFNIDEQIKTGDGTFTVSSISAADGDLVVIGNVRADRNAVGDAVKLNINDDATSGNYVGQVVYGAPGVGAGATALNVANITGDTAASSAFAGMVVQFSNFADGSNDPSYTSLSGYHGATDNSGVFFYSARRNNVEAITKLLFAPETGTNFKTGSMLSTYAVPKNLIARQELSGTASSVTFSSIPQTYDHLELSIYVRGDSSGQPEAGFKNEFNGDTTVANYKRQHLIAYGTTVGAGTNDNNTPVDFPTSTATANVFGSIAYSIQNYTKTDRHKHYMVTAGDAGENELRLTSNRWANTAAISSIVFTPSAGNFIAGSVFTLRGIHSTAPAAASDVAALNSIEPADIEAVN